jgi:pyridoxal 5'-phosphate synthase pdxT subunit
VNAPLVGVLALQGGFVAHQQRLAELDVASRQVRAPADLDGIDALVMPGGESTTMSKLLTWSGLFDDLKARMSDGLAVFGTCAGLILLATDLIDGRADQRSFGVIDLVVRRNGYGRQVESFEADLTIDEFGPDAPPFHGVFIRAPLVESAGDAVEVLAVHEGLPVLARQGRITVAAFHPELTDDHRLHARFVERIHSAG